MSGDTLVFDMSSMTEGTPQIFVKKDWLNILDNQNGNYNGNQSVVDTSQLANSNKYMNYREAYLAVPLILSVSDLAGATLVAPQTSATSADMYVGLKNWFGSIIHSFTLDYNGTTIVQQTPFVGLYNTFKLITTLSFQDVITNGASMGFYPDDALSWGFVPGANGTSTGDSVLGVGTCNNVNFLRSEIVNAQFMGYRYGNVGLQKRQEYISFDVDGITAGIDVVGAAADAVGVAAFGTLLDAARLTSQYKNYISLKTADIVQWSIMATIHLKHIHNFFQNVPLLKGVFMKMTLNLNQTTTTLTVGAAGGDDFASVITSINSPLGGVAPVMIAASTTGSGGRAASDYNVVGAVVASIGVGRPPVSAQAALGTNVFTNSIQLYVPAYTFNPVYESAYLSSPVKKVVYTDIYQYQVLNVGSGTTFNNLLTNGIANIKSVLILPFFTSTANAGMLPIQSPYDCCGGGTTSPLALLTNFNVVVAGQNMIYNTQRFSYEQFLNQLQGCNAVNADMTDGLTSSLIGKLDFESKYCYYYVNCSRMLPVEESVPKSVSIIGLNSSLKAVDLYCFIEYGVEVSIDILTGARV
jgi:hypothetical protein